MIVLDLSIGNCEGNYCKHAAYLFAEDSTVINKKRILNYEFTVLSDKGKEYFKHLEQAIGWDINYHNYTIEVVNNKESKQILDKISIAKKAVGDKYEKELIDKIQSGQEIEYALGSLIIEKQIKNL